MHLKITESRLPFAPLLLIAPFFLWGTAMVAMKGVIPHTTPFFMAGVRLVPAGVMVLIAAAWMGRPQPKGWAAWLWITLFAIVDGALFQGFLAQGLMRTGAGLGSVMIDSQPLAVALMALWLFGEKIGVWGWLGLAIGVLGISLLGLPEEWILSAVQTIGQGQWALDDFSVANFVLSLFDNGQWLMLLAALSMAVGTVLVRYVCRYTDPVSATGWHMILGGLPLFWLSGELESDQWIHLSSSHWTALAYSTIFGSAIAYGLFFYFASSGSLTSLSSLTFLTPVFALLFGNLFLSEVLSPLQWLGVGLTLVSIYLINQRDVLTEKLKRPLSEGLSPDQPSAMQNSSLSPQPEVSEMSGVPLSMVETEPERLP
jgi:drug/metabolite transporter (DMT)-like permease